jgi:hypothetical protein
VRSDTEAARAELAPAGDVATDALLGESRWPAVAAVLAFMALNIALRIWLPGETAVRVPWLLPVIEAILLVVLVTSDPSGHAERRRLRVASLVLVGLLVAAALWATVVLVDQLIHGTGVSNAPSELLASGAVVWLGNNLAFALLYWLIDGGGPAARTRQPAPVDFAFTQHMSPELAPPGWRPVFLDYLHLGFTNATAFSPTDVMPSPTEPSTRCWCSRASRSRSSASSLREPSTRSRSRRSPTPARAHGICDRRRKGDRPGRYWRAMWTFSSASGSPLRSTVTCVDGPVNRNGPW